MITHLLDAGSASAIAAPLRGIVGLVPTFPHVSPRLQRLFHHRDLCHISVGIPARVLYPAPVVRKLSMTWSAQPRRSYHPRHDLHRRRTNRLRANGPVAVSRDLAEVLAEQLVRPVDPSTCMDDEGSWPNRSNVISRSRQLRPIHIS